MAALLLSYYGDDFTGSTDVLEALARAGVRTLLFLQPPTPADLERFPGVRAVGVAGMSRTLSPSQMDDELPPVFEALGRLGSRVVHYKVCSTFDSSPEIGSIGRGIDLGQRAVGGAFVPLVVGAPVLRRYCLFGNLFATVKGETYRLDRHPTMRQHPVTPMNEADLRVHLGRQTDKRIGLVDILTLGGSEGEVDAAFAKQRQNEIVLFDVLDELRLTEVGRLIWQAAKVDPLFSAGSSGLEYALVGHWRNVGILPALAPPVAAVPPVEQVAVLSGSCSPVTAGQIESALTSGFVGVDVDAVRLLDPDGAAAARRDAIAAGVRVLKEGKSPLLYSARGPEDGRIHAAEQAFAARGQAGNPGVALGRQLGQIARGLLDAYPLRRMALAGGDTSGHGARALGIEAFEFLAPAAPGSPLCRASSRDARVDGLEIVMKGGQVGKDDFFASVRSGQFS